MMSPNNNPVTKSRLHAYTLYLMTDKEPLSPECTLAAGSLLEVCQELNSKAPTDVIQLIHAWNDQVKFKHTDASAKACFPEKIDKLFN